jgi:CspA family cold shock protein
MAVQRSVVKWFDAKKGYGFIVHPDGGSDIFVHYSAIETDKRFRTLRTGQVVAFELCDGPKGLHAQNVTEVEAPEAPSEAGRYNMEFSPSETFDTSEQTYQRGL